MQNSSNLTERAHGKGEITLDQWAIYQTYALVAPGKLAPAYRSNASTKCGTWVLTQILSQWDNLTSHTQAALTALGVRAPGALAAPTLSGLVMSTLHFTIHYSIAPADTNAVPADDGDANGIPDYIDTVMTIVEQVWAREVGIMGYVPPPPDSLDGGNSNYDVYVFKLRSGLYGYASPYQIVGDNPNSPDVEIDAYRSYLAIRNNYSGFPGTTLQALEVTTAHEFFHAIQFGYNAREKPWLMEATAAWCEDEVYDSVNDNYQYLDEWFQRPDVPLDAANKTADTLVSYPDHWYGSWIYFRHLSEHVGLGSPIVQLIWDFSATHESRTADRSSQSIAEALALVGGRTLNGVFGSFTAANLLVKNNGYGYSEGAYYPIIARTPIVRDITILDVLPRRSSRYYTFDKSQLPSCDEVFSITFTSLDPATSFGLQSVVYSGGTPSVDRMGNTFSVSTSVSWDSLAVIVMNMDSTGSTNRYQMVVEHHPKEGRYTITDIGNVGGAGPALAINQRGQVAGTQYINNGGFRSNYAFLWSDGQIRIIGSDGSTALGINDSGTVVGMVKVPGGVHAYRWSSAGGEDLDKTIYSFSRAWGVNDSGDVVGDANFLVDGNQFVMPALWKHGQMTALPFPPDTLVFTGVARSINNSGVVAGEVTLHRAGEPSSIGALRGVVWTGGGPGELDGTFDPQQINGQGGNGRIGHILLCRQWLHIWHQSCRILPWWLIGPGYAGPRDRTEYRLWHQCLRRCCGLIRVSGGWL